MNEQSQIKDVAYKFAANSPHNPAIATQLYEIYIKVNQLTVDVIAKQFPQR